MLPAERRNSLRFGGGEGKEEFGKAGRSVDFRGFRTGDLGTGLGTFILALVGVPGKLIVEGRAIDRITTAKKR